MDKTRPNLGKFHESGYGHLVIVETTHLKDQDSDEADTRIA
jgi:hypothetical protein